MLNFDDVNVNDIVSRDNILSVTTDDAIFRHYIGDYSKSMKSPLRKDSVPSFSVFYSDYHKKLMFKDHAQGHFGDCFDLVRLIFNLGSLYETCVRINEDLKLGFRTPEVINVNSTPLVTVAKRNIEMPSNRQLGVKLRKWYNCDYMYWTVKYDLEEKHLKYYNIFPVQSVFLGNEVVWTHSDKDPIYAYIFYKDNKHYYKIYRPLTENKAFKWMSSTNRTVLQGWDQLPKSGETLIITKALKDVVVYRSLGFPAIACQNEISMIKDTVMDDLKTRFKRIVINQDYDPAGIQGTETLSELYKLPYYYLTDGDKDISDYREWHSRQNTLELVKQKLRQIWPGLY